MFRGVYFVPPNVIFIILCVMFIYFGDFESVWNNIIILLYYIVICDTITLYYFRTHPTITLLCDYTNSALKSLLITKKWGRFFKNIFFSPIFLDYCLLTPTYSKHKHCVNCRINIRRDIMRLCNESVTTAPWAIHVHCAAWIIQPDTSLD